MSYINIDLLAVGNNKPIKFPQGLKIATLYLIIAGVIGIVFLILNITPPYSELPERNISQEFGSYTREIIFNILFLFSGIGLLLKKTWARRSALWSIPVVAFYSIFSFAWGLTGAGRPNIVALLISSIFTLAWNGLWFYLIFQKSSKEYLLQKNSQPSAQADRKG